MAQPATGFTLRAEFCRRLGGISRITEWRRPAPRQRLGRPADGCGLGLERHPWLAPAALGIGQAGKGRLRESAG